MKLYTNPGACSTGCHIALCWGNGKFNFEIVDQQTMKQPEFLALNPMGQVPVLVDGALIVTENVAILNYISDSFPEAKLMGDGTKQQKAIALEWLAFVNSDIHPAFAMIFGGQKISSDQKVLEILDNAARKRLLGLYRIIDQQLEDREWIAGFRSVADAYLFMTLNWANTLKLDLSPYANILQYFMRMQKDEGVVAAFKAEGIQSF